MKTRLLFLILFFAATAIFAQEKTKYFDANWKPTVKEEMVYYRPEPKAVNGKYFFKDYYKSGKLQFEGFSLSKTEEKFDGEVKYYQENGKLSGTSVFKNGVLNGAVKLYLDNGKISQDAIYKDGKEESIDVYTYKGTPVQGDPIAYDMMTSYSGDDRIKQVVFEGNPKGMRQEMYFNELKALYYGADGKLMGTMIFDLYGNPNNGTLFEFEFNPMRVSAKRIFVEGKEKVASKI